MHAMLALQQHQQGHGRLGDIVNPTEYESLLIAQRDTQTQNASFYKGATVVAGVVGGITGFLAGALAATYAVEKRMGRR